MVYDPTDVKNRKPRRLGNTPLQRYIRAISFSVLCIYSLAAYISYRRNIVPLMNDEYYKEHADEYGLLYDCPTEPLFGDIINKLKKKREPEIKTEAESKDTQADK